MEVDIGSTEAAADVGSDDERVLMAEASAETREENVCRSLAIRDSSESSRGGIPDLRGTCYDIFHYRTMTITRSGMTLEAIKELINRCVEEALATHEATRAANALEAENQCQNSSDSDNGNGGNGNGENGNGGNGNPNENGRGDRPVARECTYQDFMKYQPLNFKGTNALTWWNSHKRTIRTEAAFAMSWRELMKLMTEVYCPRNEIQKMESELWNLTVKNNDLAAYTQ
ncbi:putative reverse transcriptase domain-containing protein [Tanacetum coccineum]